MSGSRPGRRGRPRFRARPLRPGPGPAEAVKSLEVLRVGRLTESETRTRLTESETRTRLAGRELESRSSASVAAGLTVSVTKTMYRPVISWPPEPSGKPHLFGTGHLRGSVALRVGVQLVRVQRCAPDSLGPERLSGRAGPRVAQTPLWRGQRGSLAVVSGLKSLQVAVQGVDE